MMKLKATGLEIKSYEERIKKLRMVNLEEIKKDVTPFFKSLEGYPTAGQGLFSIVPECRIGNIGFKSYESRFRLNYRISFLTI